MDLIDMMRAGVTKKDPFSCPILFLSGGLVFRGSRAILLAASAARALAYGVNDYRRGDLDDRQLN
jgi:hypothetical protein